MMTEDNGNHAAHTPGPWSYLPPAKDENRYIGWSIFSSEIEPVAEVTINANSEANARLIAAAPETAAERDRLRDINAELVAAFEDLIKRFVKCALVSGTYMEHAEAEIELHRALLIKAKGII